MAAELTGDWSLEGSLHPADVIGCQLADLVKADFAAGGLCEHTIEDSEGGSADSRLS